MLTLEDIRREKRGTSFYVLPGRRTTECAKHASKALAEINALTSRAEAVQKERAQGAKRPGSK